MKERLEHYNILRNGLLGALPIVLLLGWNSAHAQTSGPEKFEAQINEAARALTDNAHLKQVSPEKIHRLVEFVAGQMLYALLHEMGHALVTEMELPVLGKEEDAADAFAITTMIKVGSSFSHRILVESAEGWYVSDLRDQKEGLKPTFYDSHSLDKQRAYWIVCLMVGSDPVKFHDLAQEAKLPEGRQASCQGDYGNASWSWDKALKSFRRRDDQPRSDIRVVYGPGQGAFDTYASSLSTIRLLETVAEHAADQLVWRTPITLQLQTCGKSNAYWVYSTHTVTLCYELAKEYAELYRDYGDKFIQITLPE